MNDLKMKVEIMKKSSVDKILWCNFEISFLISCDKFINYFDYVRASWLKNILGDFDLRDFDLGEYDVVDFDTEDFDI